MIRRESHTAMTESKEFSGCFRCADLEKGKIVSIPFDVADEIIDHLNDYADLLASLALKRHLDGEKDISGIIENVEFRAKRACDHFYEYCPESVRGGYDLHMHWARLKLEEHETIVKNRSK